MTYIIGLAGPGHVGKSTTAKNLVKSFNKMFPELKVGNFAFAGPLYKTVSDITNISIDKLKDEIYKETPWTLENAPLKCLIGWTPRKMLQIIGTECFRNNISENFWVEYALKNVNNLDIAISEDSRFDTEYEMSNIVFELKRNGIDYLKNHPSAMPPNQKYIYKTIELTNNMNYDIIVNEIYSLYKGSKI